MENLHTILLSTIQFLKGSYLEDFFGRVLRVFKDALVAFFSNGPHYDEEGRNPYLFEEGPFFRNMPLYNASLRLLGKAYFMPHKLPHQHHNCWANAQCSSRWLECSGNCKHIGHKLFSAGMIPRWASFWFVFISQVKLSKQKLQFYEEHVLVTHLWSHHGEGDGLVGQARAWMILKRSVQSYCRTILICPHCHKRGIHAIEACHDAAFPPHLEDEVCVSKRMSKPNRTLPRIHGSHDKKIHNQRRLQAVADYKNIVGETGNDGQPSLINGCCSFGG